jgi:hypothetical protein
MDNSDLEEGLAKVREHDSDGDVDFIVAELGRQGIAVKRWDIDEDGDVFAGLGRAVVVREDEYNGLFLGDVGELRASVVGAERYGNRRVSYGLLNEEVESVYTVEDLDSVEREEIGS